MPTETNTEMTSPAEAPGRVGIAQRAVPLPDASDSDRMPAEPVRRQGVPSLWLLLAILAVVLGIAIVVGLLSRTAAEHRLVQTTAHDAVLSVNTVHPSTMGAPKELALPGNTEAFNDTPIYARTSGYLKQWFVDIGAHVRKGQLMAIIETPEIDEQLQVAEANAKSAQADLALAKTTSERYQNLLQQDSVSKQETDVAVSGAAAKLAALEAAQANVRRLKELQAFERVYAPFDGVVTARNTDIGDLIDAGGGASQPRDLFRIASINKLRVFTAVPEIYVPAIHNGAKATLTLDEYPGHAFVGTVARNSEAIDPNSRTLNVEVDVDNASHELLPGAYVFVHFQLPAEVKGVTQPVTIPANALLFRAQGTQVALVQHGHVHLQDITIAKDEGSTLQVGTGLVPSDDVILNPADSLVEGQPVRLANQDTTAGGAASRAGGAE